MSLDLKKYSELLGTCWSNYNSFETMLRVYLVKYHKQVEEGLDIEEGKSCGVTYLTNYMTIKQLLNEYDKVAPDTLRIHNHNDIIRFRDSMSHGKTLSKSDITQLTVYKYSKPSFGKVVLEIKQHLSDDYLKGTNDLIHQYIILVDKAMSLIPKERNK